MMRRYLVFLAATGCAYQDDDGWNAVDKACADAPWTAAGWDEAGLPEPLASDEGCQQVLAEHTGADALGDAASETRERVLWSAWTLALAPMEGPVVADAGTPPQAAWADMGQAGIYEAVVQRLAEAEAGRDEVHELHDGVWTAVNGLDHHAAMLPVMVHASQHWRRAGHDPCPDGADETEFGKPCDTTWDSASGWEATVSGLLAFGVEGEDATLAAVFATQAVRAADAIDTPTSLNVEDEDGDDGGVPPEGIE